MPAMLRKSGLKKLQKFKSFINKQSGDISKKLKDKTISNTLDNKIDTLKENYIYDAPESDFYKVGDDIFKITEFQVSSIRDDGGASGYLTITFYDENGEFESEQPDSWIKYDDSDRLAFDCWYSQPYVKIIKPYILNGIKEAKIKMDSQKYNL